MEWDARAQAELADMAAKGFTGAQIAAHLGTTRNAVLGRAHRTGVKLTEKRGERKPRPPSRGGRRSKITDGQRAEARRLYSEGLTYREIAIATDLALGSLPMVLRGRCDRRPNIQTGRRYDLNTKIAAVAATLTGESRRRVSLRLGMKALSIANWASKPEVFAAASALAERVKARWAAEAQAAAEAKAETEAAERARIEAHNAPIFARMSPRHREIIARRVAGETLQTIGEAFGVTRERVRQIEIKWRLQGLIVPRAKPLTEAAARAVYVPTGARRGRKPTHSRPPIEDWWQEAHAIADRVMPKPRRAMRLSDAERKRRSEWMKSLRTHHAPDGRRVG